MSYISIVISIIYDNWVQNYHSLVPVTTFKSHSWFDTILLDYYMTLFSGFALNSEFVNTVFSYVQHDYGYLAVHLT